MDNIIVDKSVMDEDGFYDIGLTFVSDIATVKCNMYVYEDDIIELKNNIGLIYELKLKEYIFEYNAIGLSDNVSLKFNVEKRGYIVIEYIITNNENIFKSSVLIDMETMNNIIKNIRG